MLKADGEGRFAVFGYPPAATVICLLLGLVFYCGLRVLGHDGFFYVEYTKEFTVSLPDRLGSHWPYGFPVLGSLLVRVGLPAYWALSCLSVLALFGLMLVADAMMRASEISCPRRAAALLALAAVPGVYQQGWNCMSELFFAFLVFLFIWCLARERIVAGVAGACATATAAVAVRYAGGFLWLVFAVWVLLNLRRLYERKKLVPVLFAGVLGAAATAGLLYLNYRKTGFLSGAARPPGGWTLRHFFDFGLSLPGLFSAGAVGLLQRHEFLAAAAGTISMAALTTIGVSALRRPRSRFSRPAALVLLGYPAAMVIFRCLRHFDNLDAGRFFLPVLFPAAVLLWEVFPKRRTALLSAGAAVVFLFGAAWAVRGVDLRVYGRVTKAAGILARTADASAVVVVNDRALSLAAYVNNRVRWARSPAEVDVLSADYVVVAAEPLDRVGVHAGFAPEWAAFVERVLRSGRFIVVFRDEHAVVLQRRRKDAGVACLSRPFLPFEFLGDACLPVCGAHSGAVFRRGRSARIRNALPAAPTGNPYRRTLPRSAPS